jgi:hypothetical protein
MIKDIVVIDIESTGVDTDTNEIIGISSVLIQSQKITGFKYETWCNAPKEVDKEARKIIGKKIGFFEDQPSLSDAIKNLGDFTDSRMVVALNPTFCSAFLYKSGYSGHNPQGVTFGGFRSSVGGGITTRSGHILRSDTGLLHRKQSSRTAPISLPQLTGSRRIGARQTPGSR